MPRLRVSHVHPMFAHKVAMYGADWLNHTSVDDVHCVCDHKPLYEHLLGIDDGDVMAYKTCLHTLFGAAKRQMKCAPTPDPAVADDFLAFAERELDRDLGTELNNFGYSLTDWLAHLNTAKREAMLLYAASRTDATQLTAQQLALCNTLKYEGLVKIELQKRNGKPRMVCKIPLRTKYVMGPVTWHLEELLQHSMRGYCGGKNLREMSDLVNHYAALGFTQVVEGDGSAFDNTQDITLKRVDHYLYRRVAHAIHHVPRNEFLSIALNPYKTMRLRYYDRGHPRMLFEYSILGTVFSGDTDTTLCNTMRMALYNRYVNERAGLRWGVDYVCFAKGDDFTVMYRPHVKREQINAAYYRYFLPAIADPSKPDTRVYGLGQVLKKLEFGGLNSLTFCSLRAWYIDLAESQIILTRDPAKFYNLSRYSRRSKCMRPRELAVYLEELALALRVDYPGIHIFQVMADAYHGRALQFAAASALPTHELLSRAINRCAIRLEVPACDPVEEIINGVKHRACIYQMQGAYWDDMQRIERCAGYRLSPDELARVNQQIDAEFAVSELRSILGVTNAK